ncbi:MAG TPA: site-2 protease family protein, partial [Rhizomicrobium sp.]|nr:site-2 protease family protein [Rhizomicrobium sp.]
MLDAIRSLIAWTPLGLPAFLFVITLVVFFHELGHFLVARWFGVKVDVFSVGFGKEIFGWTDRLGTRWKVSWLPVGGYVKFAGDANAASQPDAEAAARMSAEEREGALLFKPLYQRALVAASGPLANFLLAIVILTGLSLYAGHAVIQPIIGQVTQGSPAEAAGIKPGDRVTR